MKNIFLPLLVVSSLILISNLKTSTPNVSSAIITNLDERPVLPKTPFEYRFKFPDHLRVHLPAPPYYTDALDTTVLPFISKEISTLGAFMSLWNS